jgi:hypothetical protein
VEQSSDSFHTPAGVRALVLSVDLANNKLGLGLKPSYFKDLGLEDEEDEDADEDAAMRDADLDELEAATSDSGQSYLITFLPSVIEQKST